MVSYGIHGTESHLELGAWSSSLLSAQCIMHVTIHVYNYIKDLDLYSMIPSVLCRHEGELPVYRGLSCYNHDDPLPNHASRLYTWLTCIHPMGHSCMHDCVTTRVIAIYNYNCNNIMVNSNDINYIYSLPVTSESSLSCSLWASVASFSLICSTSASKSLSTSTVSI